MESLVLFAASFYISWVLFAAVYYVICYAHGDFEYEDVDTAKSANDTLLPQPTKKCIRLIFERPRRRAPSCLEQEEARQRRRRLRHGGESILSAQTIQVVSNIPLTSKQSLLWCQWEVGHNLNGQPVVCRAIARRPGKLQ